MSNVQEAALVHIWSEVDSLFDARNAAQRHTKTIAQAMDTWRCEHCGRSCSSHDKLKIHHEQHKRTEDDLSCAACGIRFDNVMGLRKHISTSRLHNDFEGDFRCNNCEDYFTTARGLSMHSRIHKLVDHRAQRLEEKLYSCDHCEATFRTESARRSHLKQHSDPGPHPCGECGKTFKSKHIVSVHKLNWCRIVPRHPARRTYACDTCGITFTTKAHISRHAASYRKSISNRTVPPHLVRRPYTCDACGKSFTKASSVGRHQKESYHAQ